MKTPLHTIEGLEREIAQAPAQARTGAKFLNLDTRVIEWLLADARAAADADRITEINKGLVHSHNILLVDGSKWQDRAERLQTALQAIYEWYDRDGSVGEADRIFEESRAVIASAVVGWVEEI